MPTITAERIAGLNVLDKRSRPFLQEGQSNPIQVLTLKGSLQDFRTSELVQPGGLVYVRQTLAYHPPEFREAIALTEYWFPVPTGRMTIRNAYPRFARLFREGIPLLQTSGLAEPPEPQLYLVTDRFGRPLIHPSFFRDAEDGQYKERYY